MSWAERAARAALPLLILPLVSTLALLGCERERAQQLGAQSATSAAPPVAPVPKPPPDPVAPPRISPEAVEVARTMTGGADIRRVVAEISDDRYAGRAPGTPGDQRTRAFLAAELKTLGFEPGAANGSYEQPLELV